MKEFKSLKEKCEYYRSSTDYRLNKDEYVIVMLDGRSFSKKIKNKFNKPFDEIFSHSMDLTTKYLCENIQGCKIGYCQSDEISLVIKVSNEQSPFFDYRLCKLQSICASIATAKFNQLMNGYRMLEWGLQRKRLDILTISNFVKEQPLYEFDCKAWNVPNSNDAFAWLLYRQNDCVRNSKQQYAQTYLPYKELRNLNTDEQIKLVLDKTNNDWDTIINGWKYGRFVIPFTKEMTNDYGTFQRNVWEIIDNFELNDNEAHAEILSFIEQ